MSKSIGDSPAATSASAAAATAATPKDDVSAPLLDEIARLSDQQLSYALADVDDKTWQLFASDGELRLYTMEKEVDGIVIDPLKAVHSVRGVSAREFIDIFFDPSLKKEWDDTVVKVELVESKTPDIAILHQVHKRIWPSAQRESLFWSARREFKEGLAENAHSGFMVCNHDCEREDVPLTDSSCIRVGLTICMVCQTVIEAADKPHDQLTRDDIRCRITYVAQVHPGGWVMQSALRQVYKREYPKFLRKFSAYVLKKVASQTLQL